MRMAGFESRRLRRAGCLVMAGESKPAPPPRDRVCRRNLQSLRIDVLLAIAQILSLWRMFNSRHRLLISNLRKTSTRASHGMHGSHGMHSGGASGDDGPWSRPCRIRLGAPARNGGNGEIPTPLRDLIKDVQTVRSVCRRPRCHDIRWDVTYSSPQRGPGRRPAIRLACCSYSLSYCTVRCKCPDQPVHSHDRIGCPSPPYLSWPQSQCPIPSGSRTN
jgi:hypothetical protein